MKPPGPKEGQSFTAVGLVTVVLAVVVPVTDEGRVRADACRALKLSGAALELICREGSSASEGLWLGAATQALRVRGSFGGRGVGAPLPSPPRALTAVWRLVRVVPTVVLRVTLPPEGDALVVLAHKLEGRWGQEGLVGVWGTRGGFLLRG